MQLACACPVESRLASAWLPHPGQCPRPTPSAGRALVQGSAEVTSQSGLAVSNQTGIAALLKIQR